VQFINADLTLPRNRHLVLIELPMNNIICHSRFPNSGILQNMQHFEETGTMNLNFTFYMMAFNEKLVVRNKLHHRKVIYSMVTYYV